MAQLQALLRPYIDDAGEDASMEGEERLVDDLRMGEREDMDEPFMKDPEGPIMDGGAAEDAREDFLAAVCLLSHCRRFARSRVWTSQQYYGAEEQRERGG